MNNKESFRELFTFKYILIIWIPILLITVSHYSTSHNIHWLHDIFRRLYYIPIIISALVFGKKRGLFVSLSVSILYFPHAFLSFVNMDPAGTIDKILEIVLYNVISLITAVLSENIKKEKEKYQNAVEVLNNKIKEINFLKEQLIRDEKLKALGEMSAGLAHEIKNPLASIKGACEIINDDIPKSSYKQKFIEIQEKEFNRLISLLEQFLDFAKPNKMDMEKISLETVVDSSIELIKTQIKNGRIKIILNRHKDRFFIKGNKEKLIQVFLNLFLNAVESIKSSGYLKIDFDKRVKGQHDFFVVIITDNGEGINDEIKKEIFNPFFTTKDSGTGLGLSIALKIMEQHKGFIEIKSQKQPKQTSFILYFPQFFQS